MASSAENDAALARALQAQYDQEEQHNGNDMGVFDATLLHRRASNQQQSQPAENSILTADEALARQLAAQEQAEASAQALQVAHHHTSHAAPFVQEEAEETVNDDEDIYDTSQAQKAQQEYEDSRMALQWQRQEQERARAVEQAQQPPSSQPPPKSRTRRILMWLATFLGVGLVIGVVYAIASQASGGNGNGGGLLGDILNGVTNQDIANNDPFTGQNQANTWEIDDSANHLDMIVLNALQSPWYPYFYKAVGDWDDGALEETNIPDVLELESQVVEYDYNCTEVVGFVKVCNGNYQETGWRGINDLVRVTTTTALGDTTTYLISSRARMNDYYVNPAVTDNGGDAAEISTVYDDSQYVMCHELGHAWGLLHTDEDFDNADTFNCMDYTRNSRDNQQPGTESLAQLAQMYGGGGSRRRRRSLLRSQQQTQQSSLPEISKLPPSRSRSSNTVNDRTTHADWLRREMEEVYDRHSGRRLQPHKWKVLHQNDYAEAHEVELSHGHVLQVHKLLA